VNLTYLWTVLGTVAGIVAAFATLWWAWVASRATARQEARERERLNYEVLGRVVHIQGSTIGAPAGQAPAQEEVPPPGQAPAQKEAPPAGQAPAQEEVPPPGQTPAQEEVPPPGQAPAQKEASPAGQASPQEAHTPSRDAVYDQLLINDYALGLTQARRAFNVSMAFSILGGLVLVLGVALAIFRAATGGQVAGAAITSAAGVLTSGLSQLFREQSTKALKHLESQAVELRKDVRAQTNAATAQRLLEEIADDELRSHLQAALILEFTGAKLPDLGRPSQLQLGSLDGRVSGSEVTMTTASSS
jgi:hypothetical protein